MNSWMSLPRMEKQTVPCSALEMAVSMTRRLQVLSAWMDLPVRALPNLPSRALLILLEYARARPQNVTLSRQHLSQRHHLLPHLRHLLALLLQKLLAVESRQGCSLFI